MDTKKLLTQNSDFLNLLRFYKQINKPEIANYLNLSMPTIYKIIDELNDSKIINKDDLSISKNYGTLCGISIGSSLCKIVFLDMDFSLFSETRFLPYKETLYNKLSNCGLKNDKLLFECFKNKEKNYIYFKTPSQFATLKTILDSVFDCIKLWHTHEKSLNFLSIGISCTGVINEQTHTILNAHIRDYLNETTLTSLLFPDKQAYFKENEIDIYLVQNANAAMIAEKINLYQTNSKYIKNKNIMSLYLGGGIGAGLYFEKIYSGTCGYSGEIGHIQVPYLPELTTPNNTNINDKIDLKCTCGGKNCYEHRIRTDVFQASHEEFCDFSSKDIKDILDESAEKASLFGSYLGHMINTITNLLNLDLIIFTGKFYKSMNILFNHIAKVQDENHLKFSRNACTLLVSQLGPKAPAIGAAIYSYHMKYNLDLSWEYYIQ